MSTRQLSWALRRPPPKEIGILVAVPITVFVLVGLSAAFLVGSPESFEKLERHIKKKQEFLRKKRAGELPKGARLYPRRKKKAA